MHIRSIILLIMVSLISVGCTVSRTDASTTSRKPQPPAQVEILTDQQSQTNAVVKPGDAVPVRIAVIPAIDATEMRIVCTLSEGVELVSGALTWSGPARKGEEQILPFTVRSPRNGKGSIASRVELYSGADLIFSMTADRELGAMTTEKPQQPLNTRKDSRGQRVDEYR